MRKSLAICLFLILLGTSPGVAQTVIINDGFDDGDFTNNPTWTDPEAKHIVNSSNRLQLDAPSATDEAVITTSSSAVYGEWEAYIRLGFNPSSSNLAKYYILSDTQDLKGDVNGYYILIGDTENEISLYRQDGANSTKIIDGTDDLIDSNPVNVRIKATRDVDGNWELLVDTSGGTSFVSQGTTTDATHTTSSYVGFLSDYTSTRSDLFEYDDVKVTKVNPPLRIENLVIQDNSTFDVHFNLDIDAASVSPSDFSIDNGTGSPNSTSLPSSDVVRLSYSSALGGNEYTLTVNNIDDSDGNTIAPNSTVEFTIFDTYSSGDVIINEFMYDPPSGQAEYVELKNLTGKFLNLQNWQIGDEAGNGTISTDTLILRPNNYLVVSTDTSALYNVYGTRPYVQSGSLPSLNNSGDVVKVLTGSGSRADSMQYTPEWGGDNVALERRSDTAPSIYQENFGDSPNTNGGTPGIANEISDDTTPPDLDNIIITNNQTLDLDFSERLENGNATNTANYSLDNGINITNAQQTASDSVQLSLSATFQNGTTYQLSITNQQDIFGNTAGAIDTSFTYYEVTAADSGDVFINEFMYDPPEGSSEYIEIYNPTSESFDLNGWTINDNTGTRQTITSSQFIVPPDSFVVIAPDQTLLTDHPDIALVSMGSSFPSLNNSGDDIVLRDSTGQRLDSLSYNSDWPGAEIALERRSTNVPPVKANFGEALNGFGTPGADNQIATDTTPPDISAFTILDNRSLQFVFTEQMDEPSTTDISHYALSGGIGISSVTLASGDTATVNLSESLQNDTQYTATIDGVEDLFGNALSGRDTTFTYYEVTPADSGDIFINEFNYDPAEGTTEYIELFNTSSKSLDLQNWTINDNTGNRQTITGSQFIVPPDSFVVIAPDQTLLTDHPDIALVSMGSSFPSLNNSGDDIVLRDGSGERLDSLQYTDDWGGTEIALERRTTDVEPAQANFGEAPNDLGTPGEANEIAPDNVPPDLQSFSIVDAQKLEFVFTEKPKQTSAENTANYTISGDIDITAATLSSDTVRVSLSTSLQNNTAYTATINGINDLFGNTLTKRDTTFTYYEVAAADSGDIFINELMFDPPSGQAEYIELYNPTGKSLDLQYWTINDNTGNRQIITQQQFIIPPESFAVIAPDQTLLTDHPDIALVTMGSNFPSLNNSGDDIVLRDQSGQQLDSLRYSSEWGGSEVALERRSIQVDPVQPNFGNAPNGFGTPGATNQIQPDETPPSLNTLRIIDNTTLQLIFSEPITGATATDQDNYQIAPTRGIQLISAIQDTVTLLLSQQLQSEQPYTLTIRNLQDVFGNTMTQTTRDFTFVKFSDVTPGDIVINEFLYRRESAGDPEFVELLNTTDQNFDLSGWKLGDASGTTTLDAGIQLRAGDYLVLTDNSALADGLENGVYISNFPSLNDDEDAIYIQNANEVTIDSLFYNARFGGNTDGKSAERKDPQAASNDPANFATSTADAGSTPGAENAAFAIDESSPSIVFSRIFPNGDIELRFSEFISLTPDVSFSLNQQPLTVDSFDSTEANMIYLNTPSDIATGAELVVTAENLSDVKGNVTASAQQAVAQPLTPGDVVINEILFDPLSDSEDNQPDQSEYIELRNTRDYAISLQNVALQDAPDEDGQVRRLTPVRTDAKYIPAQGTALIYADEAPDFNQSQVAEFFELTNQPDHTLLHIDRSTLSLASTDDAIYLTGKEGAKIDSVFYDESWHNPNLADTDGISLERINPFGPSNDASNWGSSTNTRGGTPNSENSIFQETGNQVQNDNGIRFSPNPFSPDDDGTDDRLFINYKLDQPDYLITVRIYDRYGREVRELADGKAAGFEGSLIWDGLKDNGDRNRIGIYIVIFKAYDSANGNNKTFKETVVLARRLH